MSNTIIIDNINYTIHKQENITILKSAQKDKYGYNTTIKFPNNTPQDNLQKIVENFFKREF